MDKFLNKKSEETKNEVSEDIYELLEVVEDFLLKKSHTNWLIDIYKFGANVFKSIPDTKFSSIYLLSDDDYLFEHKFTNPIEYEDESKAIYEYLINQLKIGEVIETNKYQIFNLSDYKLPNNGIIIPLSVSTRILGLVVISANKLDSLSNPTILKIVNTFASLLATYIENCYIIRDLDNTQSLLEQRIAQRTFDLTQSQRELRAIIDSVLAGIIVYEEVSNKILKVNPIALEILKVNEENIIGSDINDYLENIEIEGNQIQFNKSKNSYESNIKDSEGNIIPIIRTTNKLFLFNKNVIIESFVDIKVLKEYEQVLKDTNVSLEHKIKSRTEDLQLLIQKLKIEVAERERAEKELKRLFEREKELNELKSKFVNLVSHEFRTPLTIIKSSTQMFQKFGDKLNNDEKDYYYRRIIKTVDYLNDLIENSLFIGKNDNQNYDIKNNHINLHQFFQNLISEFLNSLDEVRNIRLQNNDPLEINSDERLLYLICSNLLTNAHKYSPIDKDIILEYILIENNLYIRVIDFGIGIPEEDKMKVFNQFFRGSNIGNTIGTGLGLAVVKESIEKLNGTIKVFSQVDEGTTFELSIPVRIFKMK